jgi:tRNA pseudouridine55 synthase
MKPSEYDGLLVLDKPSGITSRTALDRALVWFPRGTRMGHTGTLDPLATGVLVLCLGTATRLADYVQRMSKTYRAGIRLGARSDTDDADGTITATREVIPPEAATVATCLNRFIGTINQVPPAYSAAKLSGQRAYDLAREGQEVSLTARPVTIYGIDILHYSYPLLELEIRCGKGTYIRSLARDLGEQLGCGALVQTLRRTRVGPFTAESAVTLEAKVETARAHVQPLARALTELPRVTLPANELKRFCQGQAVPLSEAPPSAGEETVEIALFDGDQPIAIGSFQRAQGLVRPVKVLHRRAEGRKPPGTASAG